MTVTSTAPETAVTAEEKRNQKRETSDAGSQPVPPASVENQVNGWRRAAGSQQSPHFTKRILPNHGFGGSIPVAQTTGVDPLEVNKVNPFDGPVERRRVAAEQRRQMSPERLLAEIKLTLENSMMLDEHKAEAIWRRVDSNRGSFSEALKLAADQKLANGLLITKELERIFKHDINSLIALSQVPRSGTQTQSDTQATSLSKPEATVLQFDPAKTVELIRNEKDVEKVRKGLEGLTPEQMFTVLNAYQKKYGEEAQARAIPDRLGRNYIAAVITATVDPSKKAEADARGFYWALQDGDKRLPTIFNLLNGKTKNELMACDTVFQRVRWEEKYKTWCEENPKAGEAEKTKQLQAIQRHESPLRESLLGHFDRTNLNPLNWPGSGDRRFIQKAITLYFNYAEKGAVALPGCNPVAKAYEFAVWDNRSMKWARSVESEAFALLDQKYTKDQWAQVVQSFADLTKLLGSQRDLNQSIPQGLKNDAQREYAKAMVEAIRAGTADAQLEADIIGMRWAMTCNRFNLSNGIINVERILGRIEASFNGDKTAYKNYMEQTFKPRYNSKYQKEGTKGNFDSEYKRYQEAKHRHENPQIQP